MSTTADSSDTDTEGDTDTGGSTAGTTAGSDTDDTTAGPGGSDSTGSDSDTDTTTAPTTDPGTSEPTTDSDTTDATDPTDTTDPTTDPTTDTDTDTGEPGDVGSCFTDKFSELVPLADYDQYMPIVGSHCVGTNHQDIEDVERVVFLGDSVTVGTPPTPAQQFYRAQLADALAMKFGIAAPDIIWKQANPFDGKSASKSSGAFSSCSEWGARTDDFVAQIADCFDGPQLERTLIVITMGGNDLASIAKDATDPNNPLPMDQVLQKTADAAQLLDDAVVWLTDPMNFPNGSFVIYANVYEYTDRTGDLGICQAAQFQNLQGMWPEGMPVINSFNEALMETAVSTGTDMIFMSEEFCGHGFYHDEPTTVCYEEGASNWFDFTCIHPTPEGHGNLAGLFMAVVDE
ncbi:MAG: SGNH/GDSL hydrolase family protein [Myxococcales bacterium]|nr:SGNH/GDSL hydrolase family protein [Myxococcales bacterium]